jgi:hypothetical protein
MHEDKSLMCSIQHFSNNKTPSLWGVITFSFELIIKCYKGLVVLWFSSAMVERASKLFEDLLQKKKCTVTKLQEIQPLSVHSPAFLPRFLLAFSPTSLPS